MHARFGPTTGVLVKLLDSAMRLPIHCHPSREFARATLGSPFGKAEAWIVIGTRAVPGAEPPNVRIGFRDEMPRDVLRDLIDRQDAAALLDTLVKVPVEPGDVIFVPPGVPHAIGAGVFLAEVQEPTDFSVVAEWADYPIDPADAHLRIGWDRMIDCFDRRRWAGGVGGRGTEMPLTDAPSAKLTLLLGPEADEYFGAARLQVHDHAGWPFTGIFTVGIAVGGSGTISNQFGTLRVTAGDSFTIFAGAPASELTGSLDILVCTPPSGMARFRR